MNDSGMYVIILFVAIISCVILSLASLSDEQAIKFCEEVHSHDVCVSTIQR